MAIDAKIAKLAIDAKMGNWSKMTKFMHVHRGLIRPPSTMDRVLLIIQICSESELIGSESELSVIDKF